MLGISASGPVALVDAPRAVAPRPASPERDAWTVLAAVHGLGPVGLAALLARYGGDLEAVAKHAGVHPNSVHRLLRTAGLRANEFDEA